MPRRLPGPGLPFPRAPSLRSIRLRICVWELRVFTIDSPTVVDPRASRHACCASRHACRAALPGCGGSPGLGQVHSVRTPWPQPIAWAGGIQRPVSDRAKGRSTTLVLGPAFLEEGRDPLRVVVRGAEPRVGFALKLERGLQRRLGPTVE